MLKKPKAIIEKTHCHACGGPIKHIYTPEVIGKKAFERMLKRVKPKKWKK